MRNWRLSHFNTHDSRVLILSLTSSDSNTCLLNFVACTVFLVDYKRLKKNITEEERRRRERVRLATHHEEKYGI